MIREIVTIDEDLCDGCGKCIPACHEGALKIVNGKAKLVSDRLCDGLGACLGHCPRGAIRVERREAEAFDEQAVAAARAAEGHDAQAIRQPTIPGTGHGYGMGCPGSRFAQFGTGSGGSTEAGRFAETPSALTHWPIQLHLLSPTAPNLRGARLLVVSDCVPVAYGGFHADLLAGRVMVMACPKLDDPSGYLEKLTEIVRYNDLQELVVARMEVPCCGGILQWVLEARDRAGSRLPVEDVVVGVRGEIKSRRRLSAASASGGGVSGCSLHSYQGES